MNVISVNFDTRVGHLCGARRDLVPGMWRKSASGRRGLVAQRTFWVIAASGALALATAGVASAAPWGANAGQDRGGFHLPKIGHVWTIMLENKSYEATFTGLNQND